MAERGPGYNRRLAVEDDTAETGGPMMGHFDKAAPLAITMGDPCGIGPEIVVKLAVDPKRGDWPLIIVGDVGALERATRFVGAKLIIQSISKPHEASRLPTSTLAVLQVGDPLPDDLPIGRLDGRAGDAAYRYVEKAIRLAMDGDISGIVTAPINKAAMMAGGHDYPGHTEILAELSGTRDFAMMLANDELRVLLVSIHVSLREAIEAVTQENEYRAIRLAEEACHAFGISKPRIAVAGLNPHAGEDGMFGREDVDVIAPAIAQARADGFDVSGPWPGDTIFMRARRGEFDVVVAQYHDQGLIPVKYLGVDKGVNITVGLPFVRTSVDHGTAFDLAGTGRADHSSLVHAFEQAAAMIAVAARR